MKKLSKKDFHEIDVWIHRNARELEIAIWNYHFAEGNQETVINALSYYQNDDGGFGNTLEPDSWNPNSSPYTTLRAINILRKIEFIEISHPIYQGIIKYLENCEHYSDIGWHFTISTNDDYAHPPWFTYNAETNAVQNIGITAEISTFIVNHLKDNDRLYAVALKNIDHVLNLLSKLEHYGDMGILGYSVLLSGISKEQLEKNYDYKELVQKVRTIVNTSIQRDTTKWVSYGTRPSKYVYSPKSVYYEENKDIIHAELDYLIDTRPKNSVWGIPWSWFENNEKYAKEFAISENWWKADCAIAEVKLLSNFDRIEK